MRDVGEQDLVLARRRLALCTVRDDDRLAGGGRARRRASSLSGKPAPPRPVSPDAATRRSSSAAPSSSGIPPYRSSCSAKGHRPPVATQAAEQALRARGGDLAALTDARRVAGDRSRRRAGGGVEPQVDQHGDTAGLTGECELDLVSLEPTILPTYAFGKRAGPNAAPLAVMTTPPPSLGWPCRRIHSTPRVRPAAYGRRCRRAHGRLDPVSTVDAAAERAVKAPTGKADSDDVRRSTAAGDSRRRAEATTAVCPRVRPSRAAQDRSEIPPADRERNCERCDQACRADTVRRPVRRDSPEHRADDAGDGGRPRRAASSRPVRRCPCRARARARSAMTRRRASAAPATGDNRYARRRRLVTVRASRRSSATAPSPSHTGRYGEVKGRTALSSEIGA